MKKVLKATGWISFVLLIIFLIIILVLEPFNSTPDSRNNKSDYNAQSFVSLDRKETLDSLLNVLSTDLYSEFLTKRDESTSHKIFELNLSMHEYLYVLEYLKNRGRILNESSADVGLFGSLNKWTEKKRLGRYQGKIGEGDRDSNKILVLAEGDSWFTYPIFIKEILDYLFSQENLIIRSTAYGGDWLSNYGINKELMKLYEELKPNVLLLSGGGNDMVGNSNLSSYVIREKGTSNLEHVIGRRLFSEYMNNLPRYEMWNHPTPLFDLESQIEMNDIEVYSFKEMVTILIDTLRKENAVIDYSVEDIIGDHNSDQMNDQLLETKYWYTGNLYLNDDFFHFIKFIYFQYILIIENIKDIDPEAFDQLHIILQGYDYVIPSSKTYGYNIIKLLTNSLFGHGEWLELPLQQNGISDPKIQQAILKTMIDHLYFELSWIQNKYWFKDNVASKTVTIVDSREVVQKPQEWYNELHPTSEVFEYISSAYIEAINSPFEHRESTYFSKKKRSLTIDKK